MSGGAVIRKARARSGLTQGQLAGLLGTTASAVSRWERGHVEPSYAIVDAAVTACGLRLYDVLSEPEVSPDELALLETTLALTPEERLNRLSAHVRFIHAGRRALASR